MTSNSDRSAKGRSVLVIGGRGFVGSHIVRRLLDDGWNVHVFGMPMSDDLLSDLDGRFGETEGSVEDRTGVLEAMRRSGAEAVVMTAAHSAGRQGLMKSGDAESDRALAVNVIGLRNVFEAALQAGIRRLVWTDSTVVYAPAPNYDAGAVDEDAERAPVTFYGLTKVLGEDIARYYRDRHGMEIVGLRLPLLLGPGLWYAGAASAIVAVIAEAAPGARHEVAFHDEAMDLMHVADAASAVAASLESGSRLDAVYNLRAFTARLSDFVREVEARVPGYKVEHRVEPPATTFPLIDDRRFRRDAPFEPARFLAEVVDDMLSRKDATCTKSA